MFPGIPSSPPASVTTSSGNATIVFRPEEDTRIEVERSYNHNFSKSILEQKIKEYKAEKYTKKYIQTYLEFMFLNGMIDNLGYLEYKNVLAKE